MIINRAILVNAHYSVVGVIPEYAPARSAKLRRVRLLGFEVVANGLAHHHTFPKGQQIELRDETPGLRFDLAYERHVPVIDRHPPLLISLFGSVDLERDSIWFHTDLNLLRGARIRSVNLEFDYPL